MHFAFSKYQGAGNDFLLIDDRSSSFPYFNKEYIKRLCHRHFGVGADGLVLLKPSEKADFGMKIFNSDASCPSMCGNGLRCLIDFFKRLGDERNEFTVETEAGVFLCRFHNNGIGIVHEDLFSSYRARVIRIVDEDLYVHAINSGVPHVLLFKEDIHDIDLEHIGRQIRFHPAFQPDGTNVSVVKTDMLHRKIHLRTYERGVEKETLACGTAVAAAAFTAAKYLNMSYPMEIVTASQEIFKADLFSESRQAIEIIGPAAWVFEGKIDL